MSPHPPPITLSHLLLSSLLKLPMPPPKPPPPPPPQPPPPIRLQQPPHTKKTNRTPAKSIARLFRRFRRAFQSFPIGNPPCRMPNISPHHHRIRGGTRMTGTLFGSCKSSGGNFVIQENPRCHPMVVLELSIPTAKLLQDMGSGLLVRIGLECEKHHKDNKLKLMEEPIWTMYSDGRKTGYGVRREPSVDDLALLNMLYSVSMGAGVLPSQTTDGDQVTYMRAHFDRVVGSKDSETYYMMNPPGHSTSDPELTIFFVRL